MLNKRIISLHLPHLLKNLLRILVPTIELAQKFEAEELEPKATIDMKIYGIKADHVKGFNYLNMKISAITSNKPFS